MLQCKDEAVMIEKKNLSAAILGHAPAWRQVFAGIAIAVGALAMVSSGAGAGSATSLHQEVDLKANPQRIYEMLLDAKQFSAFTGFPAEIDGQAGGAFKCFGGRIVGRNIELTPNRRIVQAWRVSAWPEGAYSIVKFEL